MSDRPPPRPSVLRSVARIALGAVLVFAGTGHLTFARQEFQAQVPESIPALTPFDADTVVLGSGVVEIALGAVIALAPRRHRPVIGIVAALFFVAVLPGNIAQLIHHKDAFGLDSDAARALRLLFQPLLVLWAWWSTRR